MFYKKLILVYLFSPLLFNTSAFAEQSEKQSQTSDKNAGSLKHEIKYRSGFSDDKTGSGSQSSVAKQLYLDDIFVPEHLRFPGFDKKIQPYYEWKRDVRKKYDLELGTDYTSLFQTASDSLTSNDTAGGGVFRLYGRWIALNKDKNNSGSLVFKIENSHRYGSLISPDELGQEVGYLGSTGLLYSDFKLVLNDFNWLQQFNDDRAELVFGRLDLNDYMDVVDYANPWTTFQNSNILENHSIALPDTGFGLNLANWLSQQWYLKVGAIDANGSLDDLAFFEHGSEFFSYAEIGWSPSSAVIDLKGIHLTLWHADQRVAEGVPEGEGVAIGGGWSFDKEWVVFGRAGQSTGAASLMRRTLTAGVSHIWKAYFDVFGLAINYSEPTDQLLRNQTTLETFLKVKITQNIAVTPSFQLLINPALNPQEDIIGVAGLRLRLAL